MPIECISCSEIGQAMVKELPIIGKHQPDFDVCSKSHRACGHHCNHSWSHDKCCWCGREFGELDA